ncbi:hypothetical protein Gorai_016152, partial [Gossypium raimondii]|nr:hypothetical protein [Gossypium raimondii]
MISKQRWVQRTLLLQFLLRMIPSHPMNP